MSPATLSVESIFESVINETNGFAFGKPERPNQDSLACILPLLRKTSQVRQYVTMPETDEVIVSDSGSINRLNFENHSKSNVYVRSGMIFEGKGTQSRAVTRSSVIYPGQKVSLDCRCVHASHPINSGSGFNYGGVTPTEVESANYAPGYVPRDQSTMWNSVHTVSASMSALTMSSCGESVPFQVGRTRMSRPTARTGRASGPTRSIGMAGSPISPGFDEPITSSAFLGSDNLKKNFDAFAANFDEILSKARLHDDQVGIALITTAGCRTVELFDVDKSWEAIHKDSVKRMGTELLRGPDTANVFEYKPEHAANAVRAVLGLPWAKNLIYEHKPANGEPHLAIWGITAKNHVGEVVELDHRVIHMLAFATN